MSVSRHWLVAPIIFSAFSLLLAAPTQVGAGFGVSPPGIKEDKLVKGSHLERTIYLVQGNPTVDLQMEIIVESDKIKDWITFKNGTSFTIPAGVQQYPLEVVIDVPQNAELGIYKAFIRANTKPKPAEGGENVSIALAGRIDVELVVGDDVFSDFNVRGIRILDIKEGKPLKVSVRIENIGNVPARPERITFELFDKFGEIRLAYAQTDQFKEVSAFKTEEITAELPIELRLGVGDYWGNVKVYKDGSVVKNLRGVFSVKPRPFYEKYWWSILVVLALIGAFFYILKRKRA